MSLEYIWLFIGVFLALAEIIVPGLITIFVGLACITSFLFLKLGCINNFFHSFIVFIISSIIYLLIFRSIAQRFLPSSFVKQNVDEDIDAIGDEVEVLDNAIKGEQTRILYRGTTWQAKSLTSDLNKGDKAVISCRDNITWVIKRTEEE